jgi:hypothetical protein
MASESSERPANAEYASLKIPGADGRLVDVGRAEVRAQGQAAMTLLSRTKQCATCSAVPTCVVTRQGRQTCYCKTCADQAQRHA